eukprot:TRINITY_DN23593_c0_g1_i3.p1 TRINITY_DN23593_c0_g1~~TRINITY_DN23593_c0_g1_i3.p1  ORF type:complete len:115 (+),score=32.27 TRINITY_DN23593_c0_g1_i3:137-481(+)
MASVESRLLVRELEHESREQRLLPQASLDDGISLWRHLYAVVDEGRASGDFEDDPVPEHDRFGDTMLRLWIRSNLELAPEPPGPDSGGSAQEGSPEDSLNDWLQSGMDGSPVFL